MTWTTIWMDLFATTSFLGIDMGFWVAMAVVSLIVILMNVVFWGMKPKSQITPHKPNKGHTKTSSSLNRKGTEIEAHNTPPSRISIK